MTRQYLRKVRVTVGLPGQPGRSWTGLRVQGNVTKTDSPKPNKAKIQIYNLTEASRGLFQQDGAVIQVLAGYGEPELIFQGDVGEVDTKKDGRDIVLEVQAADGKRAFQSGSLFVTWEGPLTSTQLLTRISSAMGLGLAPLPVGLPVITYVSAYTISGPARAALDDLMEDLGALWSIQDGVIVVSVQGASTQERAFLVSPTSGLINSPEAGKRGVKFRMLLNGKIRPRRPVRLESEKFQGWFIPKTVEHIFDSGFAADFYTDVEAIERNG